MVKKCIHVSILDFELFSHYNKFHTKFHLWSDEFNIKYSDVIEFHVIELTKIRKYIQEEGELLNWAKFFNSESKEDFKEAIKENQYIKEAYMDVLNLSKNEKKYYEYRARERALKDKVSFINAAKREGLSEGIKQGIDQGISQGRTDIIKSALETGKTPETVAEFIGIPLEEVLRVQNEL